jgi:hypothetical protein
LTSNSTPHTQGAGRIGSGASLLKWGCDDEVVGGWVEELELRGVFELVYTREKEREKEKRDSSAL